MYKHTHIYIYTYIYLLLLLLLREGGCTGSWRATGEIKQTGKQRKPGNHGIGVSEETRKQEIRKTRNPGIRKAGHPEIRKTRKQDSGTSGGGGRALDWSEGFPPFTPPLVFAAQIIPSSLCLSAFCGRPRSSACTAATAYSWAHEFMKAQVPSRSFVVADHIMLESQQIF